MIVNPGIRRFLGSAIQRLFNSASFYAPLTHTLALERGTGSPTFTRASTATFTDWEGVLRTVPSGCARFEGARMVRNLATNSETLTFGGGWSLANISNPGSATVVAPDGTTTAWLFTATANFGQFYKAVTTMTSGGTQCNSLWLRRNTGTGTVKLFDKAGGYGATVTLTSEWARFEVATSGAGTGGFCGFELGTSGDKVEVWHPQLEDVTGQADQTASEYVSVGQLSAPYHGAGVDGVEFFNTDRDGAVIPAATNTGYLAEGARTNLCLQSNAFTTTWTLDGLTPVQDAIGPDGATSAWTFTDNSAVAGERIYQSAPLLTAAAYTLSVFIKKTTGAQTGYPVIDFYPTAGTANFAGMTVDTTNGIATAWTARTGFTMASGISANCVSYNDSFWRVSLTVTGTASNYYVVLYPAGTTNPTQSTGALDDTAQGSAVFYGAQVELGSFASSPIATTTAAVTRNADVLTYSSAGNILGTAGAAYAEWTFPRAANLAASWRIISAGAGGVASALYLANAASGDLSLFDGTLRDGPTPAYPVNAPTKSASTWGGSAATITNAGTSVTTAFDGDMNVGSTIDIGCIKGIGGFELNGTIRNVRIWQRQLSASELQAITS